jgi:hypothetical protein
LLLDFLQTDPRDEVKLCALADLRLVAKEAPHLWTRSNWQTVVEFAEQRRDDPPIFAAVLALLALLVDSESLPDLVHDARMRRLCLEAASSTGAARVSVEAAAVLTTVVRSCLKRRRIGEEEEDDFVEDALLAVQARALGFLAGAVAEGGVERHLAALKRLMGSIVRLSCADDEVRNCTEENLSLPIFFFFLL